MGRWKVGRLVMVMVVAVVHASTAQVKRLAEGLGLLSLCQTCCGYEL